jgi:hypothetical protein
VVVSGGDGIGDGVLASGGGGGDGGKWWCWYW